MVHSTTTDTLEAPKSLLDIFPPVRKSHIMNCAFATWHPIYRHITPKARTIPLTPEFMSYLREDGIVLPDDEEQITTLSDSDTESDDETEDDEGDGEAPPQRVLNPTERFPELHQRIKTTVRELGGSVAPKLNWSAPKDAAFMTATNTLECRTPGEVYLLLKSSDFVTHDLEHAFRDCTDDPYTDDADADEDPTSSTTTTTTTADAQSPPPEKLTQEGIPYHLVLRKWFPLNPSLEFRVFVSSRRILAISQRDPNHYDFLAALRPTFTSAIRAFFAEHLAPTFPDTDFVFDVYLPHATPLRVWLIDINPFAPRTDPLLFSWVELLRLRNGEESGEGEVEMRLVGRDDPEAYQFASQQYSASKLPRDVVEVGLEGEEAVWEFARRWRDVVERTERERAERQAAAAAAR
ncbi:D123-domain-containing protein [Morchella snyderi]|nr:D123-domain-containing protein [Morchella snyderi]